MSKLDEIEEIKKLKARYFRLLDQKRWEEWEDVFTEDATVHLMTREERLWRGKGEIVRQISSALVNATSIHHGHMPEIELTGDTTATGIWAMSDYVLFADRTLKGYGHYEEEYVKENGKWKIKRLRLTRLREEWCSNDEKAKEAPQMKATGKEKAALPPVTQIGIVVKDIEKTVQFYTSVLGLGPWDIRDGEIQGDPKLGKPGHIVCRFARAKSGPIEIELVQPLKGESLYTEFLRDKGEGLHHLGFFVTDIDAELDRFAQKGARSILGQDLPVCKFAYLAPEDSGGVILELLQWKVPVQKTA